MQQTVPGKNFSQKLNNTLTSLNKIIDHKHSIENSNKITLGEELIKFHKKNLVIEIPESSDESLYESEAHKSTYRPEHQQIDIIDDSDSKILKIRKSEVSKNRPSCDFQQIVQEKPNHPGFIKKKLNKILEKRQRDNQSAPVRDNQIISHRGIPSKFEVPARATTNALANNINIEDIGFFQSVETIDIELSPIEKRFNAESCLLDELKAFTPVYAPTPDNTEYDRSEHIKASHPVSKDTTTNNSIDKNNYYESNGQLKEVIKVQQTSATKRSKEDIRVLIKNTANLPFFEKLTRTGEKFQLDTHKRCCKIMYCAEFSRGDVVIKLGDTPKSFYIVISGEANVYVPTNEEFQVNQLKALNEIIYANHGSSKYISNDNINLLLKYIPSFLIQTAENIEKIVEGIIYYKKKFLKQKKIFGGVVPGNIEDKTGLYDPKTGILLLEFATKVKTGKVFGEIGLQHNKLRAATIIAEQGQVLAVIDKSDYMNIQNNIEKLRVQKKLSFFEDTVFKINLYCDFRIRIPYMIAKENRTKQEHVYHEGDKCQFLYIIKQGDVLLYKKQSNPRRAEVLIHENTARDTNIKIFVAKLGVGEIFGETEILDNKPNRDQNAICLSNVKLFKLSQDMLERFRSKIDQFDEMLQTLHKKKQSHRERMISISQRILFDGDLINYEEYKQKLYQDSKQIRRGDIASEVKDDEVLIDGCRVLHKKDLNLRMWVQSEIKNEIESKKVLLLADKVSLQNNKQHLGNNTIIMKDSFDNCFLTEVRDLATDESKAMGIQAIENGENPIKNDSQKIVEERRLIPGKLTNPRQIGLKSKMNKSANNIHENQDDLSSSTIQFNRGNDRVKAHLGKRQNWVAGLVGWYETFKQKDLKKRTKAYQNAFDSEFLHEFGQNNKYLAYKKPNNFSLDELKVIMESEEQTASFIEKIDANLENNGQKEALKGIYPKKKQLCYNDKLEEPKTNVIKKHGTGGNLNIDDPKLAIQKSMFRSHKNKTDRNALIEKISDCMAIRGAVTTEGNDDSTQASIKVKKKVCGHRVQGVMRIEDHAIDNNHNKADRKECELTNNIEDELNKVVDNDIVIETRSLEKDNPKDRKELPESPEPIKPGNSKNACLINSDNLLIAIASDNSFQGNLASSTLKKSCFELKQDYKGSDGYLNLNNKGPKPYSIQKNQLLKNNAIMNTIDFGGDATNPPINFQKNSERRRPRILSSSRVRNLSQDPELSQNNNIQTSPKRVSQLKENLKTGASGLGSATTEDQVSGRNSLQVLAVNSSDTTGISFDKHNEHYLSSVLRKKTHESPSYQNSEINVTNSVNLNSNAKSQRQKPTKWIYDIVPAWVNIKDSVIETVANKPHGYIIQKDDQDLLPDRKDKFKLQHSQNLNKNPNPISNCIKGAKKTLKSASLEPQNNEHKALIMNTHYKPNDVNHDVLFNHDVKQNHNNLFLKKIQDKFLKVNGSNIVHGRAGLGNMQPLTKDTRKLNRNWSICEYSNNSDIKAIGKRNSNKRPEVPRFIPEIKKLPQNYPQQEPSKKLSGKLIQDYGIDTDRNLTLKLESLNQSYFVKDQVYEFSPYQNKQIGGNRVDEYSNPKCHTGDFLKELKDKQDRAKIKGSVDVEKSNRGDDMLRDDGIADWIREHSTSCDNIYTSI